MKRADNFPFDVLSVAAARRFAAECLGDVPPEVFDAVQLMVSELATNSVRHAKTGFRLAITRAPESVRVEVADLGGGVPEVRFPAPTDPTGRGLAIVEMFSDEWGVEYAAPTDKTVWFTLAWAPPRRGSGEQSRCQLRAVPAGHAPVSDRRRAPSCLARRQTRRRPTCRARPRSGRRSCAGRGL
jgi:serine/threonine-protein kinase RsbW